MSKAFDMGRELPPLAVIAGPTASGKSALALAMAESRNGVIINADASQIYADLCILSARPSHEDEARAPHRLYGVMDGAEACTALHWADLARGEIAAAWQAGRLPILVGGTGLYLRSLLHGLAEVPPVMPAVRQEIRSLDAAAVRQALEREDGGIAARLHPNDSQRNARALEVVRSTGRSLLHWQAGPDMGGLASQVNLEALVVEVDRAILNQRIEYRVQAMWQAGAREEVASLLTHRLPTSLPVMRAIGVPPLAALLRGEAGEAEALDRWKLDTRRYAKRQQTWMRNQFGDWLRHDPLTRR